MSETHHFKLTFLTVVDSSCLTLVEIWNSLSPTEKMFPTDSFFFFFLTHWPTSVVDEINPQRQKSLIYKRNDQLFPEIIESYICEKKIPEVL